MIDKALVARVEGSLATGMAGSARAIAELHPELGSTVVGIGTGQAILFGPGMWVNRVVSLGLDGPVDDADFDRVDGIFERAGLPVEFDVNPWADESLLAGAAARGMSPQWFRSLLVKHLPGDDRAASRTSGSVSVRPADDLGEWADVSATGFGYHDAERRLANDTSAEAAELLGDRLLVAVIDGAPVGVGAIGIADGVATLYGMSTVPAARRQGVQSALIAARVDIAIAAGCDLAVSTAMPGSASERNLMRPGFDVVCTKLGLRADATGGRV
jgi:GNAT superfamily N-acetyltransferase